MKTSDRLNKIASVAENVENAAIAKEIAKQNEKQALIDLIATYADRIKAIIEVGSKLVENKMPLGKKNCFQSNGLDHRFGFMVEGSLILNPDAWKIIGIGREGGGWAGNDFLVNSAGEVIEYSHIYNCESWTEKFEQFEKDFYNYVDNEI
jgi:hypothetical protein